MPDLYEGCLTDVPGIKLGHAQSDEGKTGCTVVILEEGAIAGVDIGGSAPGMRETEMLNPTNMILKIHAILLSGGSTFGLQAAGGVQRFLQEREIGFMASTGVIIPIVPSAVIFDLDIGKPQIYPGTKMGYEASKAATSSPSKQGKIGAAFGATCGKVLGSEHAMNGGLGTASYKLPNGVIVSALAVCNSWGDVIHPDMGEIIAGARYPGKKDKFLNTENFILEAPRFKTRYFGMDTTLCVVATNARFSREQITKVAMMAQDGIARTIRPSHTMLDGDVVFALSTNNSENVVDVNIVGSVAALLVSHAIVRGVLAAN
jgi:L-aminopeptidase/D-esterase-like protein